MEYPCAAHNAMREIVFSRRHKNRILEEEMARGARTTVCGDFVGFHAAAHPGHLAAVDMATGAQWSYRDLHDRIGRCVTVLTAHGVCRGNRVAVLARNSVDLVVVNLACARAGAIFVVLNWRLPPAELSIILADAMPCLLVVDKSCQERAGESSASIPMLKMEELAAAIGRASVSPPTVIDFDAPAIMLYTSGTTGKPKGVVLSERNAYHTGTNFSLIAHLDRESVLLCEVPLFHVIGLVIGLRACLYQGAAILISDGFNPSITNDRLRDPALGISHYFCVPQMVSALRAAENFDLPSVRALTALIVGGAPTPPEQVVAWLDDGVSLINGYGMTEIGCGAGMPFDENSIRRRPGSVGLVPPTQRMRAVDQDGFDVQPGTAGEIWVRGPNVFQCYWKNQEETDRAFAPDGWFKTGDIGVFDEQGFLTLVDRKKDMFISGGENVYPAEVELALLAHPDIREAAVVGMRDVRWGEAGYAFLVLQPGASISHADLRAHCAARIAGYKLPKYFVVMDKLPRTGSGKIQKHVIRKEFEDGRHAMLT
jgi:fatty-acyl-CoA synthase